MMKQSNFDSTELLDQVRKGLNDLGNKNTSFQMRMNYATKFELQLLCSFYNTTQSKFVRSAVHSHFTKLMKEDERFNKYCQLFSQAADMHSRDDD